MTCTRCGRPLLSPAASIQTRGGVLSFGRACATKVGLLDPKPRARRLVPPMPQPETDERQMTLEVFA